MSNPTDDMRVDLAEMNQGLLMTYFIENNPEVLDDLIPESYNDWIETQSYDEIRKIIKN